MKQKNLNIVKSRIHWKYLETLRAPWWYLICSGIVIAIFAYELDLAFHNKKITIIVCAILILATLWGYISLSQGKVGIASDNVIYAGKAQISSQYISRAFIVQPEMKSAALGRQSDPMAFVFHRAWVRYMVLLILNDPLDPTPYWIFSVKNPTEFLQYLPPHIEIIPAT